MRPLTAAFGYVMLGAAALVIQWQPHWATWRCVAVMALILCQAVVMVRGRSVAA